LPHARLERDQAQAPEWLSTKVGEQAWKFVVLEVGRLFPLGPGSLRGREFSHGVGVGVAVVDGCLQAGPQDAQMLCTRRGRAAALTKNPVEARNVLGADSTDALTSKDLFRVSDRRAIGTDG